jgi:hypothetical protein
MSIQSLRITIPSFFCPYEGVIANSYGQGGQVSLSSTSASVGNGAYVENKLVKAWNRLFRGFNKFVTFMIRVFTNNAPQRIANLRGTLHGKKMDSFVVFSK